MRRLDPNQRSVDTQTGTFTTVDPLVVSTRDPYIYANANPIGLSDPSGLAYNLCPNGGPKIDGEYCPGKKKNEDEMTNDTLDGVAGHR
jgi:hypothetical protein